MRRVLFLAILVVAFLFGSGALQADSGRGKYDGYRYYRERYEPPANLHYVNHIGKRYQCKRKDRVGEREEHGYFYMPEPSRNHKPRLKDVKEGGKRLVELFKEKLKKAAKKMKAKKRKGHHKRVHHKKRHHKRKGKMMGRGYGIKAMNTYKLYEKLADYIMNKKGEISLGVVALLKSALYYGDNDVKKAGKELDKIYKMKKMGKKMAKIEELSAMMEKMEDKLFAIDLQMEKLKMKRRFYMRKLDNLMNQKRAIEAKIRRKHSEKLEKKHSDLLVKQRTIDMEINFLKNEMKYYIKEKDKRKIRRKIFDLQVKSVKVDAEIRDIEREIQIDADDSANYFKELIQSDRERLSERLEILRERYEKEKFETEKEMEFLKKELY